MKVKTDELTSVQAQPVLNICSKAILKVLLYFDIFRYPLRENEIRNFLSVNNPNSIKSELEYLEKHSFICHIEGFYFIENSPEVIKRRINANLLAENYLKIISKHVRWFSKLPFVSCICVSGSLSKKYMDKKSDIDYFIITKHNRLWIVRAILSVVYKILWLFRSGRFICPNYIISENNLEINDRNIFTAVEITTLIPMYNQLVFSKFIESNTWVKKYFPNFNQCNYSYLQPDRKTNNTKSNDWLTKVDDSLFQFFKRHYQNKFKDLPKMNLTEIDLNFSKDQYKMHISGHRNKILDKYEENLIQYQLKFGIEL